MIPGIWKDAERYVESIYLKNGANSVLNLVGEEHVALRLFLNYLRDGGCGTNNPTF